MSAAIIEDIVEQHFDESAFLWSVRDVAVTSPLYSIHDLAELDERLESHIDGLRVAGDYGWTLCEDGVDDDDPGTLFAATMIAFESADKGRIKFVVDKSSQSRQLFRAAVSALGWLGDDHFRIHIKALIDAKSWQRRSLAIAACGIRRVNPRAYLNKAAESSNLFLKLSAFKAAGELKRLDLLPLLQESFQHEVPAFRFEACRSAMLMGDRSGLDVLSGFALEQSQYTMPALLIAMRLIDERKAFEWLKEMSKHPQQRQQMMVCTGVVGNPGYIPMLIRQMTNPELGRVAGYAFSMITGVDLDDEGLAGEPDESIPDMPNDDPADENVAMDPYEDLSWPDAEKVERWWQQNHERFPAGTRHLAGSPISDAHCQQVLENGNQLNRQAAALELALGAAEAPFVNVKTPNYQR